MSVSMRITEPNTNAAMPPKPKEPKLGTKSSAVISTMPSTISASPA